MLSYIRSEPEQLFTFGSPRVGCKRYVNHVTLEHFRWVNNNDIVTRVPPTWLGYRHSGTEVYIDRSGQIQDIYGWRRVSDRLQGFLGGLLKFRIDQLSDHSVISYIDRIFNLARNEKNNPANASVSKSANKIEADCAVESTCKSLGLAESQTRSNGSEHGRSPKTRTTPLSFRASRLRID